MGFLACSLVTGVADFLAAALLAAHLVAGFLAGPMAAVLAGCLPTAAVEAFEAAGLFMPLHFFCCSKASKCAFSMASKVCWL